jgi:hypothetical protein
MLETEIESATWPCDYVAAQKHQVSPAWYALTQTRKRFELKLDVLIPRSLVLFSDRSS